MGPHPALRATFPVRGEGFAVLTEGVGPYGGDRKPFVLLGQLAETACTPPGLMPLSLLSALLSHFSPKGSCQVKSVVFDLFIVGQSDRFGSLGSSLLEQEKLLKGQINLMSIRAGCDPGSL